MGLVRQGEANNLECITLWMEYAQQYGHVMVDYFARNESDPLQAWEEYFVQPDATNIVEVRGCVITSSVYANNRLQAGRG